MEKTFKYADAGVNIDAGSKAVELIGASVKKTYNKNVLTHIGGFGSAFSLKNVLSDYNDPVLVQSIDGVGTKTKLAVMCNNFKHLGRDLFSAATNDIVVMGAKPLTFLNYVAFDTLDPFVMQQLVQSMSEACMESDVALVGGETAEMPGVYQSGEIDMVGIVSGVVEKDKIITGKKVTSGDIILGLSSSGLHTNGYSFARKLFFEVAGKKPTDRLSENEEKTIEDILLAPHTNYCNIIAHMLECKVEINGLAHITGGGFIENLPRVIQGNLGAKINMDSWIIPEVFKVMQKIGNVAKNEMYRSFNMGIGMVIIAPNNQYLKIKQCSEKYKHITLSEIGIITDKKGVEIS